MDRFGRDRPPRVPLAQQVDEPPAAHHQHVGRRRLTGKPRFQPRGQVVQLQQAAAELHHPHSLAARIRVHCDCSRASTASAWAGAQSDSSWPSSLVSETRPLRSFSLSNSRRARNSPLPEMTTVCGGCGSRATS